LASGLVEEEDGIVYLVIPSSLPATSGTDGAGNPETSRRIALNPTSIPSIPRVTNPTSTPLPKQPPTTLKISGYSAEMLKYPAVFSAAERTSLAQGGWLTDTRFIRGLWVDTYPVLNDNQIKSLLDTSQRAGINRIYLQIRSVGVPTPDVEYLQRVLAQALPRGIAVEAWMGGLPANKSFADSNPSWLKRAPDRTLVKGETNYYFFDPNNLEVRDYLANLCGGVASYPVAGIHLDVFRLPNIKGLRGDESAKLTEDVTATLEEIRKRVKAVNPAMPLTSSGVAYGNPPGASNYQDWPNWARSGDVDAIIPMLYNDSYFSSQLAATSQQLTSSKASVLYGIDCESGVLSQVPTIIRSVPRAVGVVFYDWGACGSTLDSMARSRSR